MPFASFDGQGRNYHADGLPGAVGAARKLADYRVELGHGLDLGSLQGAELWLGYGVGDTVAAARPDMLARGLAKLGHQLQ